MEILLAMIVSTVGFGYLMYGKKAGEALFLICGIIMMIYPYFIHNIWIMLSIFMVLIVLPIKLR